MYISLDSGHPLPANCIIIRSMQNISAFCFVLVCFSWSVRHNKFSRSQSARLVQNAIRTFEQCLPRSGKQVRSYTQSEASQTARLQHNL